MSRTTHMREARSLRDPWKRSLESLNQIEGIAGSLLATRDGLCVLNECARLRKPEVTCAMGAAVLAASETMAGELGLARKARFSVQAGAHTILGMGATDDLMLLMVLHPGKNADDAAPEVERVLAVALRETPW